MSVLCNLADSLDNANSGLVFASTGLTAYDKMVNYFISDCLAFTQPETYSPEKSVGIDITADVAVKAKIKTEDLNNMSLIEKNK